MESDRYYFIRSPYLVIAGAVIVYQISNDN